MALFNSLADIEKKQYEVWGLDLLKSCSDCCFVLPPFAKDFLSSPEYQRVSDY